MKNLFKNFKKNKNDIALIDLDHSKYTYSDIIINNNYIISKVKKKSLVLLIGSNSADFIFGYTAFLQSEFTAILLDESFMPDYVESIIKRFKPKYIFSPKSFPLSQKNKFNKILISLRSYELLETNYKKIYKLNKKNRLLLTTSGTTQNPKFVRLSAGNLKNNSDSIRNYLKINKNQTAITTMPIAYSYGLSIINSHLDAGAKIVLNKSTLFEKIFWEKINRFNVNSLNGVPQFYELLKKLKFHKFNIPSLKYITQAGGKLDESTIKYFYKIMNKKNLNFFIMYGQTEAAPRMSYLKLNNSSLSKINSIGKVLKGSKFELFNKKRQKIKSVNKPGEIVYYGKNVSLGYASKIADLTKGDMNNHILFTGDLAYKDKSDYYFITGRKNRISKIFGLRVNLEDIEKKLMQNGIKARCQINDKILLISTSDIFKAIKIKDLIKKFYKINHNFIEIEEINKIILGSSFKNLSVKKKYKK